MDTNFINLKFKSNNKTLEVGKGKPYRLLDIDGIDGASYELDVSQNVMADGSRVNSRKVVARPISIEVEYVGKDKKEERINAVRFFNLHNGGELTINNNGTIRTIPYEVEGFNAKLVNMNLPLKFLVHLYCPAPYLLSEFEISEEIIVWIGGLKFPLQLPTTFSMAGDKIINVINDGDVETPVKIEIFGTATNPKIVKRETGEFIKVNKKLLDGEVMTITTEFGNKRVEIDEVNVFNHIDYASTFFNLDVGDNVIELITDDVNDNANIKIAYRNRYIGV